MGKLRGGLYASTYMHTSQVENTGCLILGGISRHRPRSPLACISG